MRLLLLTCCALIVPSAFAADSGVRNEMDFFEKKIRPVLVEHCYRCHSAEADSVKARLRLDTAAATRRGGDSGAAVVPGKPDESLLLSALKYESFEMPPNRQLPAAVVADFEKWIHDGAADPRTEAAPAHHAGDELNIEAGRRFWAFQPPQLSSSLGEEVVDSARIDRLVERRLTANHLTANEPADRRTLLRRMSFDVVGLPPTAEQITTFVAATSSTAVTDVVDSLLASSDYGPRWARMWLDVSRYAEDQAHIVGNNKTLFYPNAWMYRDWVIAAFNDDVPYDRFIELQLAADLIAPDDDTHLPALGFIGLGPKYYRRGSPEVMAEEWEDRVDVVSRGLQGLTVACARCHDHKFDPIATEDYYALAGVFASTEMFNKPLNEAPTDGAAKNKDNNRKDVPENSLHIIRDQKPRNLHVMIRGNVDNPGPVVPRGYLEVLFPEPRREFSEGSGRRELARSIADPANPLTARVIVNRVWKEYFGQGLVKTASNFGELGERPSHPELLDDLAVRFMQNGWSLKWLHRQILLSQTYQRSSAVNPAAATIDPGNRLLWRMPRRRLSVEAWRDAVLSVAGVLDAATGGPSIRPDDPQETRRTVYASVSRFDLNPLLARFDFPDPNVHAAGRVETNTPLQKLFLFNSPFMHALARKVAARVDTDNNDTSFQLEELFQLVVQRSPADIERTAAENALQQSKLQLADVAHALLASNEFWYVD